MISNAFDDIITAASDSYGVPFDWIKAIIGAESDFDPNAYRAELQINDASYGLMQLLSKTARGLGWTGTDPAELFDPTVNINLGAKLLQELIGRFGQDFNAVYSAYNSGSGTAYQTNATVAAHVARAISYLQQVISGAAGSEQGQAGIGFVILLAGLLYWYFKK